MGGKDNCDHQGFTTIRHLTPWKVSIMQHIILALVLTLNLSVIHSPRANAEISLPAGATSRTVAVNDIQMHYVEKGEGPLVVLLHGWPQTWLSWRHVMIALSDHYRVVAPDLRGTGLSEKTPDGYDKKTIAADIQALIRHLGETSAIVVGHDMGGKAAYIMAHLYPEAVSKLVLVDCLIPGTENLDSLRGGAWHYGFHMAEDMPEMLTKGREEEYIAAQIHAWSHVKDAINADTIAEYARAYSAPGGMTAGFNYYRALREDVTLAETLADKKLSMPVLALTGQFSAGERLAMSLKSQAPRLDRVIIPDSGHFVAEEQPEAFVAALRDFIAQPISPQKTNE